MTDKPNASQDVSSKDDTQVSEKFPEDPTSDLVLKSNDNTLFYIHTRNLSVLSSVFADAHDCATLGGTRPASAAHPGGADPKLREIVEMTESATTLELLLQFIYPRPQPDLSKLSFDALFPLAEAAEKWKIYAAMSPCNTSMRRFTESHPLKVLRYAALHDYEELADEAARHTLYFSATEASKVLPADTLIRWAMYRDKIVPPLPPTKSAPRWIRPPYVGRSLHKGGRPNCEKWDRFEDAIRPYFHHCALRVNLDELFEEKREILSGCWHCALRLDAWETLYRKAGALGSVVINPDDVKF